MIRLFPYYGSKIRMSGRYPAPQFKTIIEVFAGAAGYSCRYPDHQVFLYEKDPVVAAVLAYAIRATADEILSLPLIDFDKSVDDYNLCQEAKWMIGFWLNNGSAQPCKRPSQWCRSYGDDPPANFWGPKCRARLAETVTQIKHWQVFNESWENAARHTEPATWFIDPPYQLAGKFYRQSSDAIDYEALGYFCSTRNGQVIVCENVGATWLPFEPFYELRGAARGRKPSVEALWYQSGEATLF